MCCQHSFVLVAATVTMLLVWVVLTHRWGRLRKSRRGGVPVPIVPVPVVDFYVGAGCLRLRLPVEQFKFSLPASVTGTVALDLVLRVVPGAS